MKTEILLLNLLNNFGAFIHKVKLTKLGTIEVLVKRDISVSGKFNIDSVFYFNFFFSRLIRDLRLFLCCSLADLAIVDYPERTERFVVVYNFLSIRNFFRIFVILKVSSPFLEAQSYSNSQFYIKSLTSLFNGSFWLEREGWDLFGVFFQDNTDLRRILTDYGFEGYPLRKDFPLTGFLEVRYDDEQRSVVYENLELSQEFRFFDFESPWDRQENIVFNNYSN